MTDLSGTRALVTAAGAGIGRRVAERLREAGAAVYACDVDETGLDGLAPEIGRTVCDVSDEAQVEALFTSADAALGGLDLVVCCAGTAGPIAPLADTEPAAWRACVDVNLIGGYLCAREAVPRLTAAGGGGIIFFSSTSGLAGYPTRTAYCAAKHGLIGLVRALATEVGPGGITVNAICPGIVEGERMERVIDAEAAARGVAPAAVRDGYASGNSLKTWITADDLAETVLFLAGPGGAKITGQALVVDGHTESK
ncbi:MAG: SDR family oxidoreductase [Marivibrio sp.]|uniref:SDR family oxidoreductase n=1 Tax=Marivibrio sp. TaxID=2039719 RepID=UPI0032EFF839